MKNVLFFDSILEAMQHIKNKKLLCDLEQIERQLILNNAAKLECSYIFVDKLGILNTIK